MWGKGVARKASERVFEIARDELGLKRIHLIVRPENVRAIRIYEGFGFERTGMENGFIRMELEL
jgi:RimJ/RimL family protein N-acetyltransferase